MTQLETGVVMALSMAVANMAAAQVRDRVSDDANRESLSTRCDLALSALSVDSGVLAGIRETLEGHEGTVVRWSRTPKEPIHVWVQPRASPAGSLADPTARTRAVWRAVSDWSSTVGLRFEATSDSAKADVHFVWTRLLSPSVDRPASRPAARTTLRGVRASGVITGALVQVSENRSTGLPYRPDEVYTIALHETGHVVGLKHLPDQAAFMTSGMRVGKLTALDIGIARAWYELPVGARCPRAAPNDAQR